MCGAFITTTWHLQRFNFWWDKRDKINPSLTVVLPWASGNAGRSVCGDFQKQSQEHAKHAQSHVRLGDPRQRDVSSARATDRQTERGDDCQVIDSDTFWYKPQLKQKKPSAWRNHAWAHGHVSFRHPTRLIKYDTTVHFLHKTFEYTYHIHTAHFHTMNMNNDTLVLYDYHIHALWY